MKFGLRITFSILLMIALFVIGFMYLLRGCLAKYDERSTQPVVLYFEKDGKSIIFSVVKFEKTTSYTQKGGFVSKTMSTNYFIQHNDATTAAMIGERKIKHHSDVKNFPVEILGASNGIAWVFIGEPMAFDPFTLETVADLSVCEQKNPSLKGKFPLERRYYRFEPADSNLYFTANDGSAWMLDSKTLEATLQDPDNESSASEREVKRLEKLLKQNQADHDTLMEQRLRKPSRLIAARQIDLKSYQQMMKKFHTVRDSLDNIGDSLQQLKNNVERIKRNGQDLQRKIESMRERTLHFSQMKVNADTNRGQWYGIYSKKEMEELYDHFQYQAAYNETARRQWYTGNYTFTKYGDAVIDKDKAELKNNSSYFLDGGMLLNKLTAQPIRLPMDGSFLIIYKNQVGNEGKLLLSNLTVDGKVRWTLDTQLKDWAGYLYTGKQLFITGADNKDLSGGDCNVLWCVDLTNGKAAKYDFFKKK
jgi:hypothetical protein